MATVVVPWQALSDEALAGVIEEFVTREGTEYGASEVTLEDKCRQVRDQLDRGDVVITYDDESLTSSIAPADSVACLPRLT